MTYQYKVTVDSMFVQKRATYQNKKFKKADFDNHKLFTHYEL